MTKAKKTPFHIQLSYLFASLILVFGLTLGMLQFEKMTQMLLVEISNQYQLIGRNVINSTLAVYDRAKVQTQLLAQQQLASASTLPQRMQYLPYLATAIDSSESNIAAFVAYPDGSYFGLREWTETDLMRKRFSAPPDTYWMVESITHAGEHWSETVIFLDDKRRELRREERADLAYDFRDRPWYQNALHHPANEVSSTDPHYFHTDGMLGFTYATRVADRADAAVVGVDIEISELAEVLRHAKGTPSSRIALLTANGDVLAIQAGAEQPYLPAPEINSEGRYTLPNLHAQDAPILFQLFRSRQFDLQGSHRVRMDGGDWETFNAEIQIPNGTPLRLLIASPYTELLDNIYKLRQQTLLLSLLVLLCGIGLTVYFSRFASKPLIGLAEEARAIAHFEFDQPISVQSNIAEIDDLAHGMGNMKSTIRSFLELSESLASETSLSRLLERVLDELASVVGADQGVLYLFQPQPQILHVAQHKVQEAAQAEVAHLRDISLSETSHPLVQACSAGAAVHTMTSVQLRDWFGPSVALTEAASLIAIPLVDRNANLVGAIALVMSGASIDRGRLKMAEAISGSAAVAIENQLLIHEQKSLLQAFIQLIAGAIDAKSPYTGGHCQRVPVLTRMLAEAACAESEGSLADFSLNENEWEQLHIAAWLHDCGKVTTPEHVVDKATKLETITDRIHEIRMRFEVLKRDAEIRYWQAVAQGADPAGQRAILDTELGNLDQDFAFVASCNQGGEYLDPGKVTRLAQIAARTWQRTLSDRLGISHEELQRKSAEPEASLPATEALLADKPEHLVERGQHDQIAADNPWGFKVEVPQKLYNRGELYNLSISRGTLTAEERYKINEHIIQTITMLDRLPFPRHLQQVPEIAGGHHEKMDGSGYPKRLVRQQMSIPARIMAIADIFEALTAADRPYKSGKTLSEALDIMQRMKQDQHIDPDLFELFIRTGVYLRYAQQYLNPQQIDPVDASRYL